MTKQLHHSLKGDLSSEHQFSEAKASFVKGVQSRLELGGLCMFLIHISITGGGNGITFTGLSLPSSLSLHQGLPGAQHTLQTKLFPQRNSSRGFMLPAWSVHGDGEAGENRCQWEPLCTPRGTPVPLSAVPRHWQSNSRKSLLLSKRSLFLQ